MRSTRVGVREKTEKLTKCPKCRRMSVRTAYQTTLDGEKINFKYCTYADCDYEDPKIELRF